MPIVPLLLPDDIDALKALVLAQQVSLAERDLVVQQQRASLA